jgi:hypothetical protein
MEGVYLQRFFLISYFASICFYVFFYIIFQVFVLYFIYVAKNFIKRLVEIFKLQQGSIPKLNWETVL